MLTKNEKLIIKVQRPWEIVWHLVKIVDIHSLPQMPACREEPQS